MEPEDAPRLQQRFHTVHDKPVCACVHTHTRTRTHPHTRLKQTIHAHSWAMLSNISYSSSLKEATEG